MPLYNNVIRSIDRKDPPDEGKLGYEFWNAVEELPIIKQIKDWNEDAAQKSEYFNERARSGKEGLLVQGLQAVEDTLGTVVGLPFKALEAAIQETSDRTNIDPRTFGAIKDIYSYGKSVKASKSGSFYKNVQVAKKNIPRADILNPGQITVKPITPKQAEQAIDKVQGLSRFKVIPQVTTGHKDLVLSAEQLGLEGMPGFTGEDYSLEARFDDSDKSDDPFFSSIDPSNRTEIEKFLNKYWQKEQTNLDLMRAVQIAQTRLNARIKTKDYRNIAGFIHLDDITNSDGQIEQGLINIAKEDGRDINDVYKYLKIQSVGNKQMKQTIDALNLLGRKDSIEEIKSALNELAVKGNFRSRTYNRWLRLLRYAERYNIVEKGHKESLFQMFLKSTTGGDRLSNTFIQAIRDKQIQNYKGETITIKGNRSLGSSEDLPIYTIVKLRGGSRNLKEDFRKTIMPKEFPSESIGEEFEEIAEILYRNSMDEVGTHFNPNDIDYDANISGYSIALTDAIHAMMKAADDMGIPYIKVEDQYLLEIPNSVNKKQQKQLSDIYNKALENTLKNLNIEME